MQKIEINTQIWLDFLYFSPLFIKFFFSFHFFFLFIGTGLVSDDSWSDGLWGRLRGSLRTGNREGGWFLGSLKYSQIYHCPFWGWFFVLWKLAASLQPQPEALSFCDSTGISNGGVQGYRRKTVEGGVRQVGHRGLQIRFHLPIPLPFRILDRFHRFPVLPPIQRVHRFRVLFAFELVELPGRLVQVPVRF